MVLRAVLLIAGAELRPPEVVDRRVVAVLVEEVDEADELLGVEQPGLGRPGTTVPDGHLAVRIEVRGHRAARRPTSGSEARSSGGMATTRTQSSTPAATATTASPARKPIVEVTGRRRKRPRARRRTMPTPMHAATGRATPHTTRYP